MSLLNTLLSKTFKLYPLLRGGFRHPVKYNGESWSNSLICRKCKRPGWRFYSVFFNAGLTVAELVASTVTLQQERFSFAAHQFALQ
jgi:hypothetical protein